MDERERRNANARSRQERQQGTQRRQRPSSNGKRPGKSSRARRRKRNMVLRMIILIVIIIMAIGAFLFWKRYSPSKEKADLKQYYELTNDNDLAVIIDNESFGAGGKIIDGNPYIEYSVVRDHINKRFYWDSNENKLLYTLPSGNALVEVGSKEYFDSNEKKSEDYVILKTEGKTAYIALPFLQKYTNMEYTVHEDPNRAMIVKSWGETETATVKSSTQVRYQGGVKSPILTELKRGDKVTVMEDESGWKKVRTSDGFIGYVKTNALKNIKTETISREFQEPEYTSISKDYTINMAWHNVENEAANSFVLETIAATKGLTTLAPTWFNIADTAGNLSSIANAEYVNYARQSNLEVWAVLRDFHGGLTSPDEVYQVLSYTSKRENLINQVIAAALQTGISGINLDFESITAECGEHYIQFVRELSVKCRQNGLVFSIDNYVPMPYNEHYDIEEQGIVADYVVIMGYDEHTDGSNEAGSVASYGFVKEGIENMIAKVPSSKVINGIPFYSRLWFESPKTQEELDGQAGTEAAEYKTKVTSMALGMTEAAETVAAAGVTPTWDDKTKQNYAQWDTGGGTYKIWMEDSASIEEKLKLIKSNDLAGVAEWKLGYEQSGIWDVILQYVN